MPGDLKAIGDVEDFRDKGEAVANVERGGNHARIVSKRGAQHLPKIALLGFGGDAGRRARTLAVNHNYGNFGLGGEAEGLAHQGKAAPGGRAHGANPGVGSANGHVDHADLVFHLADHDVGFARVLGHPVEHAGRRTHGIGAVELDSGRCSAHSHGGVAAQHSVAVVGHGQRVLKWLEVLGGVVVADAGQADVLVDDGLFFLAELLCENLLQILKADAGHAEGGADGQRVLGDFVTAVMSASLETGRGHNWTPSAGVPGLMWFRSYKYKRRPCAQQTQVAVHGVLVQGDQKIDPVAHVGDLFRAGPNGKKRVAAADNGLVGVVDVQGAGHDG